MAATSRAVAAIDQGRRVGRAWWRSWWAGLAVGGAIGLFGLAGLLPDAAKTMPAIWIIWLVGLLLAHDLLLEPLVHLAGRWLRRAPEVWRWSLQVGLVVSVVLALASVPVLYGVGRATQPGNTSVLPGDYPRALAGVLALVWAGVLGLGAVRHLRVRGWALRCCRLGQQPRSTSHQGERARGVRRRARPPLND